MVPADDAERRSRYEELFRSHYRAVENYLMSRYPTSIHPQVLSKTFEIAWRRFDQIPANAARGWLIGVARNCAHNELRGERRHQRRIVALSNARVARQDQAVPITQEVIAALRRAFENLSESDREMLILADWDGLSGDDLGAALGISGATAAVRLHRARARLRAHLDKEARQ